MPHRTGETGKTCGRALCKPKTYSNKELVDGVVSLPEFRLLFQNSVDLFLGIAQGRATATARGVSTRTVYNSKQGETHGIPCTESGGCKATDGGCMVTDGDCKITGGSCTVTDGGYTVTGGD